MKMEAKQEQPRTTDEPPPTKMEAKQEQPITMAEPPPAESEAPLASPEPNESAAGLRQSRPYP